MKALDKYGKLQHPYGPYKEAAAYPVLDAITGASADLVGFLDFHLKVGDQAFKPYCKLPVSQANTFQALPTVGIYHAKDQTFIPLTLACHQVCP